VIRDKDMVMKLFFGGKR